MILWSITLIGYSQNIVNKDEIYSYWHTTKYYQVRAAENIYMLKRPKTTIMKKNLIIILLTMISQLIIHAQAVYVDCINGDDSNSGIKTAPVYSIGKAIEIIKSRDNDIYIMKINPGIYILDNHISVISEKDMTDKRIIIEASVLPGDSIWTPEKMPVITSKAMKGEIPINSNFVVSFLIGESHVTIRGIKFQGYFYPHVRYFPIARFDKTKTDLLVEQCIFNGDANISQIQAGIIANGNEIKIEHCIFYKIRNTVVFFLDSGEGIKTGNGITNSVIYGTSQAVWTVSPDKDFKFENNIVSNCRYVWAKNDFNTTKYAIDNSIIVNNKYYTGIANKERLSPIDFEIKENNVIKKGEISLILTGNNDEPYLDEVDKPLPINYMHPNPDLIENDIEAGLFINREQ